jgi:hypothetical protein
MDTLDEFIASAGYGSSVKPDRRIYEKDFALYRARVEAIAKITEISQGDAVILPDGEVRRVTHCWPDGIQLTNGPGWDASFYIGKDGYCSYSGSLCPAIPREAFVLTEKTLDCPAWFFSEDYARAFSGVYCKMPFKVWACSLFPR